MRKELEDMELQELVAAIEAESGGVSVDLSRITGKARKRLRTILEPLRMTPQQASQLLCPGSLLVLALLADSDDLIAEGVAELLAFAAVRASAPDAAAPSDLRDLREAMDAQRGRMRPVQRCGCSLSQAPPHWCNCSAFYPGNLDGGAAPPGYVWADDAPRVPAAAGAR